MASNLVQQMTDYLAIEIETASNWVERMVHYWVETSALNWAGMREIEMAWHWVGKMVDYWVEMCVLN